MGVATAWGDTSLRARLVERILCETGQQAIPVLGDIPTKSSRPLYAGSVGGAIFPAASKAYTMSWMI